jgi:hypothetical protein
VQTGRDVFNEKPSTEELLAADGGGAGASALPRGAVLHTTKVRRLASLCEAPEQRQGIWQLPVSYKRSFCRLLDQPAGLFGPGVLCPHVCMSASTFTLVCIPLGYPSGLPNVSVS